MQAVRKIVSLDKGHYSPHLLSFLNSSNVENAPLIGDTFADENLSWLAKGDKLVLTRKDYPSRLVDFNDYFQDPVTVRCGLQLEEGDGKGFLLVAGDTSLGGFIAYFLPVTCSAVRIVQLDLPVRCVCCVEKGGVAVSPLPSVCASMSGVIALGCSDGSVILMDLSTSLLQKVRCGAWPERMSKAIYIDCGDSEEVVEGKTEAAIADRDSIAFIINGAGGQLDAQQDLQTNGYSCVSSLYCCPQAAALFVGYSKGQWYIWNLTDFTILFSSRVEVGRSSGPVRGMAVLEPADDPRPCLYLWVAHDSPSYCFMYALYFNNKSHINQYGVYYKDFEQCCLCYEQRMSRGHLDNVLTGVISVQSLVHSSSSPLKSEKEEVRLFVSTWWVEGPGGGRDLVVWLLDLDQWYRAQLPACAPAVAALNAYTSSSVLPPTLGLGHPLAFLLIPHTVTPYRSLTPHDLHYHPASITFRCLVVGGEGVVEGVCLGAQEEVLERMSASHIATSCQDDLMVATCRSVGLSPLLEDSLDLSSFPSHLQRAGQLMTVAIENRREGVVTDSLKLWYDSACVEPIMSLDFISNLLCSLASAYRNKFQNLCVPLFNCSGMEVSDAEYAWLRHCHLMINTLRRFFLHIIKHYSTFDISEVEVWSQAVGLISVYMDLILLLIHLQLLPERSPSDQPLSSLETDFPLLARLTSRRRGEAGGELLVEEVVRRSGEDLGGLGCPPDTLQQLVRMTLSVSLGPTTKHLLLYYTLLDLLPQLSLPPHRQKEFRLSIESLASMFGLRSSENNLVQAIWLVDNQRFQEGVEVLCSLEVSLEPWLVASVVERLVRHEQFHPAHLLLVSKRHLINSLPHLRLEVTVYVAVDFLPSALSVCKFHPLHRETLLSHCFQESVKYGKIRNLLKVPLSQDEEDSLLRFFRSSNLPCAPELILYLHLSRLRYAEAFATYEQMERGGVLGRGTERALKWEALMAGLKRSLGPVHKINMYEWYARTQPLPPPFNQEGRGWKPASSYLKLDRSDSERPRISSSLKEFSSIAIWQARALKESRHPPPTPWSLSSEGTVERKRGAGEETEQEKVVKKRPRLEVCSSPIVTPSKALLEQIVATPIIAHTSTPSTTPRHPPPSILKRSGAKEEFEEDVLSTPRKTLTFREPFAHRMSVGQTTEKEASEEEDMATMIKPSDPDNPDENIDVYGKLDSPQLGGENRPQQTEEIITSLVPSPMNPVCFEEDPEEEEEQVEKEETIKDEFIKNLGEDEERESRAESAEPVTVPELDHSDEDVVCLDSDSESGSSNMELPQPASEDDTDDLNQPESSQDFQVEGLSQDSIHQDLRDDVTTLSSSSDSHRAPPVDEENELDYSSGSEFPKLSLDFDSEISSEDDGNRTGYKVENSFSLAQETFNASPSSIATNKPLVAGATPLSKPAVDVINNTVPNIEEARLKTSSILDASPVKSVSDSGKLDCISLFCPQLEPKSLVNVTKDTKKSFIADVSVLMETIRNSIKPGSSDSSKSETLVEETVTSPVVRGSSQNKPDQEGKAPTVSERISQSDGSECDIVNQVLTPLVESDIVSSNEAVTTGLSSQTEGKANDTECDDIIKEVATSANYSAHVFACLEPDPASPTAVNAQATSFDQSVVDTPNEDYPQGLTSDVPSQGVSNDHSELKTFHEHQSEEELANTPVELVSKPKSEEIASVECVVQSHSVQLKPDHSEPMTVSPVEVVNTQTKIEVIKTQVTNEEKTNVINTNVCDSLVGQKSFNASGAEQPELREINSDVPEFTTLNTLPANSLSNNNKDINLKDIKVQSSEETLDERNSMDISGDLSEDSQCDLLNRAIVEEEEETHTELRQVSETVESLNRSVSVGFEANKTPRKKSRRTTVMIDQSVMTDRTRYSLGYQQDEPRQTTVPSSQDESEQALPNNVGKEVHQASRKKKQVQTKDKCVSTDSTTLIRKSKRLSDALNNAFVVQQERTFLKARRRSSRASSEEPSASFRERRRSSSQTDTEPSSFTTTLTKGQTVTNKLLRTSRASSEEPVGASHRSDPTKTTSHDDRSETSFSYMLRSRDSLRAPTSNPGPTSPIRGSENLNARGQPVIKAVRRLSRGATLKAAHHNRLSEELEPIEEEQVRTPRRQRTPRRRTLSSSSEPPPVCSNHQAGVKVLPDTQEEVRTSHRQRTPRRRSLSSSSEPPPVCSNRQVGVEVLPDIQEQPEEEVGTVGGTPRRQRTPRRRTLSSSSEPPPVCSNRQVGVEVLPNIQEQPEEEVKTVGGTPGRQRAPRRRTLSSSSEPPPVCSNRRVGVEILRRGAPIYRSSLSLHQPDPLPSTDTLRPASSPIVELAGYSEERRLTRHQQAVVERATTPTSPVPSTPTTASRRKRRSSNMAAGSGDEATPTRVSLRLLSRKGKESPLPPTP